MISAFCDYHGQEGRYGMVLRSPESFPNIMGHCGTKVKLLKKIKASTVKSEAISDVNYNKNIVCVVKVTLSLVHPLGKTGG